MGSWPQKMKARNTFLKELIEEFTELRHICVIEANTILGYFPIQFGLLNEGK
jgi:hypothetical protein